MILVDLALRVRLISHSGQCEVWVWFLAGVAEQEGTEGALANPCFTE